MAIAGFEGVEPKRPRRILKVSRTRGEVKDFEGPDHSLRRDFFDRLVPRNRSTISSRNASKPVQPQPPMVTSVLNATARFLVAASDPAVPGAGSVSVAALVVRLWIVPPFRARAVTEA